MSRVRATPDDQAPIPRLSSSTRRVARNTPADGCATSPCRFEGAKHRHVARGLTNFVRTRRTHAMAHKRTLVL